VDKLLFTFFSIHEIQWGESAHYLFSGKGHPDVVNVYVFRKFQENWTI